MSVKNDRTIIMVDEFAKFDNHFVICTRRAGKSEAMRKLAEEIPGCVLLCGNENVKTCSTPLVDNWVWKRFLEETH